jgi:putative glycosyltransferase (TIGR04372 family)
MRRRVRLLLLAIYDLMAQIAFVALLPVLYVIEPFVRLRLGRFAEHHIGHLSMEPELLLREQELDVEARRKKLVFFVLNPANHQLLTMIKRRITIIEGRWWMRAYVAALPILERTRFFQPRPACCAALPGGENCHYVLSAAKPAFSFTPEEDERGKAELRKMGIPEGAWFAVFHVRDARYYYKKYGNVNHAVHDFRDVPLETFYDAMHWISERGGYAVRIGQFVAHPLPDLGPRIIDYSVNHWSDFMDIYLVAKSKFFIATNSGLFSVAQIFDVPLGITNLFPYPNVPSGKRVLYCPSLLLDEKTGKTLDFPDLKKRGLLQCRAEDFHNFVFSSLHKDLGLVPIANDAEDVKNMCMDMLDLVDGRAADTEALRLQDQYRQLYTGVDAGPYAARINPRFARRYAHLIEPQPARLPEATTVG